MKIDISFNIDLIFTYTHLKLSIKADLGNFGGETQSARIHFIIILHFY